LKIWISFAAEDPGTTWLGIKGNSRWRAGNTHRIGVGAVRCKKTVRSPFASVKEA
jgi:hypothetical protein